MASLLVRDTIIQQINNRKWGLYEPYVVIFSGLVNRLNSELT